MAGLNLDPRTAEPGRPQRDPTCWSPPPTARSGQPGRSSRRHPRAAPAQDASLATSWALLAGTTTQHRHGASPGADLLVVQLEQRGQQGAGGAVRRRHDHHVSTPVAAHSHGSRRRTTAMTFRAVHRDTGLGRGVRQLLADPWAFLRPDHEPQVQASEGEGNCAGLTV